MTFHELEALRKFGVEDEDCFHHLKQAREHLGYYERDDHPAYERDFLVGLAYGDLRGFLHTSSDVPDNHVARVWARERFKEVLEIIGRDDPYDWSLVRCEEPPGVRRLREIVSGVLSRENAIVAAEDVETLTDALVREIADAEYLIRRG